MIEIASINTNQISTDCEVVFHIKEDQVDKVLWLRTNNKYRDYVVDDRIDGVLVGLLNYALRNNHDIKSNIPVSERLLFNLNDVIIPALSEANPEYHHIKILCPAIEKATNGFAVGTGISCGVDSFYALASAQDSKFKNYRVTHLVLNNVGQHGDNKVASKHFNEREIIVEQFAKENGFELIACDSNYHVLFPQNHLHCHTYANLFPILTLGNLFKIYYYASGGIKFNEINISNDDPAYFEPILLPMLSTGQLTIYSGGANVTRMNKLRRLADYKPSYNYLQVCVSDSENCGKCEKCVRTLVALEALDILDRFGKVFDLSNYHDNHDWYMAQTYYNYRRGHHDYKDIYGILKKRIKWYIKLKVNIKIPFENFVRTIYPLKKALIPNIHIYKQK